MGQSNDKPQKFYSFQKKEEPKKDQPPTDLKTKVRITITLDNIDSSEYQYKAFEINDRGETLLCESEKMRGKDSLTFQNFFIMEYYFERQQKLKILILKNSESIQFDTSLGNIIGNQNNTLKKKLKENYKENIIIQSIELKKQEGKEEYIKLSLEIDKDKINEFKKSKKQFYYEVFNNSLLYRSELITSSGVFLPNIIPISILLDEFSFNLYDSKKKQIASFKSHPNTFVTSDEFKSLSFQIGSTQITLVNKSHYDQPPTFIHYLHSGLEFNLIIGIDFTGSNGDPNDWDSLHSLVLGKPNDYENAILACGNILAEYDSDQLFPVYGFGAEGNMKGDSMMCFRLNNQRSAKIHTIQGVLDAYRKNVPKLYFSGPTNFAPIVKKCISKIKEDNDSTQYYILLMLTDGAISDMQDTIDQLVKGSILPLTVIIVGIGNANFKKMDILDADDDPLKSREGVQAARDLVQFVPFNKYKDDPKKLAEEVLMEVPTQVLEYYEMNNILPETITQQKKNKGS